MTAVSEQQKKYSQSKNALGVYKNYVCGEQASWWFFSYFEVLQFLLSNLTALPGLALRKLLYPSLFQSCGCRPAFGRGLVLRGSKQITVGDYLLCDDFSVLDARGQSASIELGERIVIGRNSAIVAKDGKIKLSSGVNIGSSVRIATQSSVSIGASTLIAAYAYIGPGNHSEEDGKARIESAMVPGRGVVIGENCWIGARATILDGVSIGDNAVVGAHAFVTEDVPADTTVAGTPAKIIKRKSAA